MCEMQINPTRHQKSKSEEIKAENSYKLMLKRFTRCMDPTLLLGLVFFIKFEGNCETLPEALKTDWFHTMFFF